MNLRRGWLLVAAAAALLGLEFALHMLPRAVPAGPDVCMRVGRILRKHVDARVQTVDGVPYGLFIVPGLMMLSLLTQSVGNASIGIYFPKFSGTIYEYLVSPVGWVEITLGFVGAAAVKAILIAFLILAAALAWRLR